VDPRLEPEVFWPRLREALAQVPAEATRPPRDARVGAVLVLIEDTHEGPRVVLTRRRADLKSHPGQVSFAGGRLDEDETVPEAALREAQEEIGLRAESADVIGVGPRFFIPPSRFWVVPVLARWTDPHELDPNPWEVDEILHVPVAQLLDPERWRQVPLSDLGSSWAWQLDGDVLWGATAVVMALLLDVAVDGWSAGVRPEDLGEQASMRPWEHAPAYTPRVQLEGLPEVGQETVPHVTGVQMRAIDRLLAEAGVPLTSLVEQAGAAVRHAVRVLVGGDLTGTRVTVLVGSGGNGAGGLAAARLLHAAGSEVVVRTTGEPRLPGQLDVLAAAGVEVAPFDPDEAADPGDIVIDAMLGSGAQPGIRDGVKAAVGWLRSHQARVVALDLPSGMLADEGLRGACVTADITVTLGAPKVGLRNRITHPYLGDLYLADLGIPAAIWRRAGVEPVTAFARGPLVRLTSPDRNTDAGTPDQGTIGA